MEYCLVNDEGCIFDTADFDSAVDAMKWAEGRGGTYAMDDEESRYDGMSVASWFEGERVCGDWNRNRDKPSE